MGCGWLGLPLAKSLLAAGYRVHGSTTSEEKLKSLAEAGIQPFLIRLGEDGINGPIDDFLSGAEILILNVPPKLRGAHRENYVLKMQAVHRALTASSLKKLVFVSSTSVYGSLEGEVSEASPPVPDTESGRQLLETERLFREDAGLQTIIIRFGGLIGPERHPVTFLSGKKGLKNGQEAVNLIHLDDCIHLLQTVMEDGHWNEVFNGVYPLHPRKREYYVREALLRKLPPPEYLNTEEENQGKIVLSSNFLTKKYSFFTSICS